MVTMPSSSDSRRCLSWASRSTSFLSGAVASLARSRVSWSSVSRVFCWAALDCCSVDLSWSWSLRIWSFRILVCEFSELRPWVDFLRFVCSLAISLLSLSVSALCLRRSWFSAILYCLSLVPRSATRCCCLPLIWGRLGLGMPFSEVFDSTYSLYFSCLASCSFSASGWTRVMLAVVLSMRMLTSSFFQSG